MAKLSYNQTLKCYTVTQWNPVTNRMELIDWSRSLFALAIRQGFMSDGKDEDCDPLAEDEE